MPNDDRELEVDRVSVSLTARSKSRYFSEAELRRRVAESDGTLFWDPVREIYLLRTERTTPHTGRISILFVVEGGAVTVINQTSDHYDWWAMEEAEFPRLGEADDA